MIENQEKYAVVFGGGGSRGAYEVGIWQAIMELHIPVGLIVGASIGAINATFAVQGANLADLYEKISLLNIIPDSNLILNKDVFAPENLGVVLKGVIRNKGYSTDNFRSLLNHFVDVDKIYSSQIDLAIVTCSSPVKPLVAFKKDIPSENFLDYVLASAGFPIFKRQVIDGKKYIDGGFWDNVPINVAIEKNYKKVIAVDLSSVGMKRPTKPGADVITIKAPRNLGGLFEINSATLHNNIVRGYADGMHFLKNL